MALKPTLNAFEHAALPEALKAEYKVKTDGTFGIDLVGAFITDKDPQGLLSALESERNDHKATKLKFDSIVAQKNAAEEAAKLAELQKTGNSEELRKHFEQQNKVQKEQFEAQMKEYNDRLKAQQVAQAESYRKAEVTALASQLFGTKAPLLVPALMQQIKVTASEFGADPSLEFFDESGKPLLGATKDSFRASLLTNPLLKDMIVASQASGGSANEGKSNVPASTKSDGSARTYKDYKPGELMALKQSNPQLFNQLKQNLASQSTS